MKKILVVGASGSLGKNICNALLETFNQNVKLYIGDYKTVRGKTTASQFVNSTFTYIDITKKASIETAICDELDCVIVAIKQVQPIVQQICINKNIKSIDVCSFRDFAAKVEKLPSHNTLCILMAGFFPGLSGVLVKECLNTFTNFKHVSVSLLQNINANVGQSGINDMLNIISKPLANGQKGFQKIKKITLNNKTSKVRQIHHDEEEILRNKLGVHEIKYWTAWNNNFVNLTISILIRFSLIPFVVRMLRKYQPNYDRHKPEDVYLQVEAENNQLQKQLITLKAYSDYGITAHFVALIAKKIMDTNYTGIKYPLELISLKDLDCLKNSNKLSIHSSLQDM